MYATSIARGRYLKFIPQTPAVNVSEIMARRIAARQPTPEEIEESKKRAEELEKQRFIEALTERYKEELTEIDRMFPISRLKHVVADFYNIPYKKLWSRSRVGWLVLPRQIAMYLAVTVECRSLPEVAREMGGYDHTTVLYARNKIAKFLDGRHPVLTDQIAQLKEILHPSSDPNQLTIPFHGASK